VEEFAQFGNDMRAGLGRAGYENAEPLLQGSAVTGKSFKTGQPFDVGRVSDFDVALADPAMLARAEELGIGLRSGGTRNGPLSERDLRALGLRDLSSQMGQQADRDVNFMICNNPATAAQRAPSVILPVRK
jgi:filamentous hemagglutinin